MQLLVRPMRVSDIAACTRLPLNDEAAYDPGTRALLPRLWRELLTSGITEAGVIEDFDRPPPDRIAAYGLLVFLRDDFPAQAQRPDAPPYINRQIVDAWRAGRSPILGCADVARANAGPGLHLHIFHESFPKPSPANEGVEWALNDQAVAQCFLMAAGYRLNEITIEAYGPEHVLFNTNGGFRVRSDYAGFYDLHPEQRPPADAHPFLLGVSRAEAKEAQGSSIGMVFAYTPPRIFFRPAEQDVLRGALRDLTDEEIAGEVSLSVAGVRKRWDAIYPRAETALPGLLPPGSEGGRGTEKKRRLLAYLRAHPEELRPFLPPK